MESLTEKKFEELACKYPSIGCLTERHSVMLHAVVMDIDGSMYAVFMGKMAKLESGTKVKLWDDTIKTV